MALFYVKAAEGLIGCFNYELYYCSHKRMILRLCFSNCVWGNSSIGMTWELVRNTKFLDPTTDLLNQTLNLTENLISHSSTTILKPLEGNTYQQHFEKKNKRKKEVVLGNIILTIS